MGYYIWLKKEIIIFIPNLNLISSDITFIYLKLDLKYSWKQYTSVYDLLMTYGESLHPKKSPKNRNNHLIISSLMFSPQKNKQKIVVRPVSLINSFLLYKPKIDVFLLIFSSWGVGGGVLVLTQERRIFKIFPQSNFI